MNLTKNQTKQLQGIAILCMLGLHLFNRSDIEPYYDVFIYIGSVPLLTIISYIFDACVPIYLFCSGYGLYKSYCNASHSKEYVKSNIKRVFNLLIIFWTILCITCLIGYLMGMQDTYPGSITKFISNVLLLRSNYVGAFWFIQTYVLLVFTSKYLFKLVNNLNKYLVIFVSLGLYCLAFVIERKILVLSLNTNLILILNAFMLYLRSQFSFIIGIILAKYTFIEDNKCIQKVLSNKTIIFIILILMISIRGLILRSMFFAPFSAIVIIILFGNYKYNSLSSKLLLYFGKHSTNIWLTHMQFYMIFASSIVFYSRNVFIIFITLIVLSLISSYMINFIVCVERKVLKLL